MNIAALAASGLPNQEAARLESIYRAEFERLRARGTMLTGSLAEGEDLAQDAFIESLRRSVDEPGYLRDPAWPWLRVTLVRLACAAVVGSVSSSSSGLAARVLSLQEPDGSDRVASHRHQRIAQPDAVRADSKRTESMADEVEPPQDGHWAGKWPPW